MGRYDEILKEGIKYSQDNPVIAAVVAIILLIFLFKRPKLFFLFIFFIVAAIGVMELFDKLYSMMSTHQVSPFSEP